MHPADREPFANLLADVFAYYGRECSAFVASLFWRALSRFDIADVERAFSLHAEDPDRGQFPPRIADITRLIEGSTGTQGMRAWANVERALRTVGAYQTVVFDDPLVHAVISDMGGWVRLCHTPAEDLPYRARDFERNYAAYRTRREVPRYPAKLIGLAESENAQGGFEVPRPVLIGDPQRAAQVMARGGDSSPLRITTVPDLATVALLELQHQHREEDAA